MYSTFEEAQQAAIMTIKKYNYCINCVITETKLSKDTKKSHFGFRFNESDTHNKFIKLTDGSYCRMIKLF